MDKMTKKEMYERVIEIIGASEVEDKDILIEKLEHEKELVTKKKTSLNKNQKANIELVEKVFETIKRLGREVTIAEVFNEMKDVEGITSTNKVSALIKKLKDTDRVTRVDNGKENVTFKINEDLEDAE